MTKNVKDFLNEFSTDELKNLGILQEKERNLLRHDSINPLIKLMNKNDIGKLEYPNVNWYFDVNGNFRNIKAPKLKEGNISELENPGNIFQGMNPIINPHYKQKKTGGAPPVVTKLENPKRSLEVDKIDPATYLLNKKKQIILYGPPGTGKTFSTRSTACSLINGNTTTESIDELQSEYDMLRDDGRIEFVTFHPSVSYEEFVEGISVNLSDNDSSSSVTYKLRTGIFKEMSKRALGGAMNLSLEDINEFSWEDIYDQYKKLEDIDFDTAPKYVLVIDEINRGDISKIFGELITLLEADKRLSAKSELTLRLPVSRDEFAVPPNLYIIGTMNTADRSIALLDVALRRRFGFIEMNPDFSVLQEIYTANNKDELMDGEMPDLLVASIEALIKINSRICDDRAIGRDRQVGHSFLFDVKSIADLLMVWKHEVLPLMEEYCYGDYSKINSILFDTTESKWISQSRGIINIELDNLGSFISEIKG